MRKILIAVFIFTAAGFCSQEPTLDLGAGAVYSSSVYKGDDGKIMPIPMVFYKQDKLYFAGKWAQYQLLKQEGFEFGALAQWRFDGYDSSDSRYLSGMSDRRMSIDGGAVASYFDGWGRTRLSFVTDLLSKHSGQELSASYGKRFGFGKMSITPSAGVLYKTNNLTNYYYGVRSKEATVARKAYKAGSAVDPFVSVQLTYRFDEKFSLMALASIEWLDDEIKASPIVDESYQAGFMFGMMYRF